MWWEIKMMETPLSQKVGFLGPKVKLALIFILGLIIMEELVFKRIITNEHQVTLSGASGSLRISSIL